MVGSRSADDTPRLTVGVQTICHGRQSGWGRHIMVNSRSAEDMSWSAVRMGTTRHCRQSEWVQPEWGRHSMVGSRGDTPLSAVGVGTMVDSRSEDDMSWSTVRVGDDTP